MAAYGHAHRRRAGRPDPTGPDWGYGTIAQFNRWTGQRHEHARERARRGRQAEG